MSDRDDTEGHRGLPRRRPTAALRPYVTGLTAYDMADIDIVHHGVPSPDLTFIVAVGQPLTVGWTADRTRGRAFRAMVSGLHDAPAFVFPTAGHAGIQLGLTPLGARALIGRPAGAVAAGLVGLDELWASPADELVERLQDCDTWAARFARIEAALLSRLDPGTTIRPELTWAWRRIVDDGMSGTGALADEIGWSRGYFARLFADEYGLRPKESVRIVRFSRAKAALGRPGAVLAEVATACGYADQAHLTREWGRLAGCTPTGWRVEMSSFVQTGRRRSGRIVGMTDDENRPAPQIWHSLRYRDAPAALDYLTSVLGFRLIVAYRNADDESIVEHAQLAWPEGGGIMIGSHRDSPTWPMQPGYGAAYVVTDRAAQVYERVRIAPGFAVLQELSTDEHDAGGGSSCGVQDPEGNLWSFGTYRGEPG